MKVTIALLSVLVASTDMMVGAKNSMVKMCLFYKNPSGHARSDPITNQQCASGHVHTFYGPQEIHPDTTYDNLINTPARFSTTPYEENQSLYWHPTIYEVTTNSDGTKKYTRAPFLDTSPYYRWDNTVLPKTEAFPPGFRMIAHSNDAGAALGEIDDGNIMTECCDLIGDDEEDCQEWNKLHFPTQSCDFLGIAFAMPTCWDGKSLGDDNDHKSHMAYTTNGRVDGPCPAGFNRRLPQIQLFVRVKHYKGGTYQLSDGSDIFHVDFFNGWKEGKLQEIIDNCEVDTSEDYGYNPPCACTPDSEDESTFLTENEQVALPLCDSDVRKLIVDEAVDTTHRLPLVECEGPSLAQKTWWKLSDELFGCNTSGVVADDDDDDDDDDFTFTPTESPAWRVSLWPVASSLCGFFLLAMSYL